MTINNEEELESFFEYYKLEAFNKFKGISPLEVRQYEKLWKGFIIDEVRKLLPKSGNNLETLEMKLNEISNQSKPAWIADLKLEQSKPKNSWVEKENQHKINNDKYEGLPPK